MLPDNKNVEHEYAMARCKRSVRRYLLPIVVAATGISAPAVSQTIDENGAEDVIHYAYAALFGTGVYRLDDRTVTQLRIPVSYRFRNAEPGQLGIRALLPITLGTHEFDFDEIFDVFDEDLSTVSFVPGLEFTSLVRPHWTITSKLSYGIGRDLSNDVSSQIYGAGISSNYEFAKSRYQYRLGTEIVFAGYRPDEGSHRGLLRFGVGVDAKIPTSWVWDGSSMFLNPHLIVYSYTREAEFETLSEERDFFDLQSEILIGLAVGRDEPLKLLGFTFDRIGLGYRYSENVRGIKVFVKFPF